MSTYHPLLDGPAEPIGLAMDDTGTLSTCGDPIVDAVINKVRQTCPDADVTDVVTRKLQSRSLAGLAKYNTPLTRTDLNDMEWLQHAQEEALDLANYLEVIIQKYPDMPAYGEMQIRALSVACGLQLAISALLKEQRRAA